MSCPLFLKVRWYWSDSLVKLLSSSSALFFPMLYGSPVFALELDQYADIRPECEKTKECAPAKHHYDECVARVTAAQEAEGTTEDCVEECEYSPLPGLPTVRTDGNSD